MKAVTIKDSDDNMNWNEKDGLLTYRPRKVYSYVPELSAPGFQNPDTAFITGPFDSFCMKNMILICFFVCSSQHSLVDWNKQS